MRSRPQKAGGPKKSPAKKTNTGAKRKLSPTEPDTTRRKAEPAASAPAETRSRNTSKRNGAPQAKGPLAPDPALTPLTYMLRVLQDETASAARRDAMAKAAAPFVHSRAGEPETSGRATMLNVKIDLRDPS
jgi:hypothetical protein